QFGRKATGMLLARVPPQHLILVTRNPDSLAEASEQGADVRYGDFDDPASLAPAFAGGDRLLLISTLSVGRRAEQHGRAIDAAKAAGIGHVVYTSTGGMHPDNPAIVVPDHRATEQKLNASGLDVTIMRDSLYAEAALLQILPRAIATGQMRSASGEGQVPFVAKQDCVAAAVEALAGEGHEGRVYEITGPELVSMRDLCALAEEMSGRRVEFVPIGDEEFDADLAAAGIPAEYEEGMDHPVIGTSSRKDILSYEQGVRGGWFALLSEDVERLTGRRPRSVREGFEDHRDEILRLASAAPVPGE
ncbi:MAG: SDR family oxidoreductase, partial [Allosphingosinicella sp.]